MYVYVCVYVLALSMCARLAATSQIVTVADALSKRLPAGAMNVVLDTGSPKGVAAAANASSGANLAIVVVGDTAGSCGESDDRMELDLLGNQLDLLEAVLATRTPTLTVLIHGRPGECRHTRADHHTTTTTPLPLCARSITVDTPKSSAASCSAVL